MEDRGTCKRAQGISQYPNEYTRCDQVMPATRGRQCRGRRRAQHSRVRGRDEFRYRQPEQAPDAKQHHEMNAEKDDDENEQYRRLGIPIAPVIASPIATKLIAAASASVRLVEEIRSLVCFSTTSSPCS